MTLRRYTESVVKCPNCLGGVLQAGCNRCDGAGEVSLMRAVRKAKTIRCMNCPTRQAEWPNVHPRWCTQRCAAQSAAEAYADWQWDGKTQVWICCAVATHSIEDCLPPDKTSVTTPGGSNAKPGPSG